MSLKLDTKEKQRRQQQRRIDRFENSYIPEPNSGCHIWIESCYESRGDMRARFFNGEKWVIASRHVWQTQIGIIPEGMCVLHHCDNSLCVNTDHLYLGSDWDNAQDREKRNRSWSKRVEHMKAIRQKVRYAKGEQHSQAMLTWDDVKAIRSSDLSNKELSIKYRVSIPHIWNIRAGKYWKE